MDNQEQNTGQTPRFDQDNINQESQKGKTRSWGWIIFLIIILLGIYFLTQDRQEVTEEPVEDEATEQLMQQSESDELDDIETDLDQTILEDLDQELEDIEMELEVENQ